MTPELENLCSNYSLLTFRLQMVPALTISRQTGHRFRLNRQINTVAIRPQDSQGIFLGTISLTPSAKIIFIFLHFFLDKCITLSYI